MNVQMFPLKPWQKALFDVYEKYPNNKWIVVKAKRQVGKSICLEGLLIAASLKQKDSFSLFISPVIQQARKVFNDVVKIAHKLIESANASLLELKFINGSVVKFGSAQQADSLRGFTVKGSGVCMIDEAAFIPDDVFYSIIVPTTNVYEADIFIVSTPKYKRGFFWNLWCKGLEPEGKVISIDWNDYDTSCFLSSETLELYRREMPKLAFQSEFLAEFIDGDGAVFTDFKKCVKSQSMQSGEVYIGVDWGTGTGSDYTVITVGQIQNGKACILYQKYFNDKSAQDTITYIVDLLKPIKNDVTLMVEKNSIGQVYLQLLNDALPENVQLVSFTTTNKSKDKIVKQLISCIERDLITLPDDDGLLTELSIYSCEINSNGLAVYNAPTGFHDDKVMSLCFCLNAMYSEL